MKKVLSILFVSAFVLIGCSNSSANNNLEKQSNNDIKTNDVEKQEDINYEEQNREILKGLKTEADESGVNESIIIKAIDQLIEIGSIEVNNEYINFINEKLMELIQENPDYNILQELEKKLVSRDYVLTDENKMKFNIAIKKGELSTTPIYDRITNEGFSLEFLTEHEGIKLFDYRPDIIPNINNPEFLCPEGTCAYLVLNNTIIHFENLSVSYIYKIKDKNGKVVNPLTLDFLTEFARIESLSEQTESRIEANKSLKEKEESKKISIGMTTDEVLERWGEPEDINKTITKNYVKEQWVYPNYQYVYFIDGIVDVIQQ